MLKFISVNYRIRHNDVLNIDMLSSATMLDADLILIDPADFDRYWTNAQPHEDGIPHLYTTNGSDQLKAKFDARKREVQTLLSHGKIVIAFLSPVASVQGEVYGSNRYVRISNYDWCPIRDDILGFISSGVGSSIRLKNPTHIFASYYKAFANDISYTAYLKITSDDTDTFFLANKTDNPVGISYLIDNGLLVLLPHLNGQIDPQKLVGVLIQCANPFLTKDIHTPEPPWCTNFPIPGEAQILADIDRLQGEAKELNDRIDKLNQQVNQLTDFRRLLYEQGKPLEEVVLRSFRLMGFEADRFREDDMEHDVILQSPEGIILAEVEGKDNDAIHIEKLDQLTRAIDEHFERNNVYPEGVLIGNAYRFTPPDDREKAFTDKVRVAADRKRFGLLTTSELFKAVIKILGNPTNDAIKAECRAAMFNAGGKIIVFQ